MIVKTNFAMLREFKDFKPKRFGILNGDEVEKIRNHFQIKERSDIDLMNLRDFVVLFYSQRNHSLEQSDIMSGIVGVIDQEKFNRGLEV